MELVCYLDEGDVEWYNWFATWMLWCRAVKLVCYVDDVMQDRETGFYLAEVMQIGWTGLLPDVMMQGCKTGLLFRWGDAVFLLHGCYLLWNLFAT
jgi:hypothetical protein